MNVEKYMRRETIFFLIVLLEGFASVAIEVLSIRQLVPFFGSNTTVTSLIIGFFLLFLAIGYFAGGSFSSKISGLGDKLHNKIYLNILLATIIFAIGLSYGFMEFFFGLIGLSYIGLCAYLLLVISPISFFLGQTLPLMSNYFSAINFGHANGKVLFLSTVGSFLGSIATTTLLMRYLGVGYTIIFLLSILFLTLILVSLLPTTKSKIIPNIFLAFSVLFLGGVINYPQQQFFAYSNEYSNARISNPTPTTKLMHLNNSFSSKVQYDKSTFEQNFEYINLVKRILFSELKMEGKNILILGAGGFTLSDNLPEHIQNEFIYVDLDRDLKKLSEEHFLHSKKINGQFIARDAIAFLHENNAKHDVVMLDVYTNKFTIPKNMLTMESFELMRRNLNKDGIFVANIIMEPFLQDSYSKIIDNTIRSVFDCSSIPVGNISINSLVNMVYFCKNKQEKYISTNNKYE